MMNKTEYDEIKVNLIKKSLEKDQKEICPPKERRKGEDGRLNFIRFMIIIIWAVVLIIMAMIVKAGEDFEYINQNILFGEQSNLWNLQLLKLSMYTTIGCFFICNIVLALNITRNKRRNDKIKKSLIFCDMLCVIIAIFLIFKIY